MELADVQSKKVIMNEAKRVKLTDFVKDVLCVEFCGKTKEQCSECSDKIEEEVDKFIEEAEIIMRG